MLNHQRVIVVNLLLQIIVTLLQVTIIIDFIVTSYSLIALVCVYCFCSKHLDAMVKECPSLTAFHAAGKVDLKRHPELQRRLSSWAYSVARVAEKILSLFRGLSVQFGEISQVSSCQKQVEAAFGKIHQRVEF